MSTPVTSVLQARNRSWQNWGTDGLYILTQGVALLLFGLGMLLHHHDRGSNLALVLVLLSVAVQLDQVFFRKIVGWLKSHIAYPRTGYTTPPTLGTSFSLPALLSPDDRAQLRKEKWHLLVVLACLAPWLILWGYGFTTGNSWVFAAASLWLAVMLLVCSRYIKGGKVPWYLSSPVLLAGAWFVFFPADLTDGLSITIMAIAVTIVLTGATALSRYLKEHPAPRV